MFDFLLGAKRRALNYQLFLSKKFSAAVESIETETALVCCETAKTFAIKTFIDEKGCDY